VRAMGYNARNDEIRDNVRLAEREGTVAMLIGGGSASVRHARVTRVRVPRRGSGHDGAVGTDCSIDPYR
jgi:hypothetical protein